MFERFTADARATVVDAQEVARERGATSIGVVHLLVALADQPDGVAGRALAAVGVTPAVLDRRVRDVDTDLLDDGALAAIGIDLAAVRARTDAAFGPGSLDGARTARARRGHVPFTAEAKKCLELSLREAVRLGDRSIDSGHVLRAILRDQGTTAHQALVAALGDAGAGTDALLGALRPRGRAAG
ncbi:hypothetical protein IF650_11845 [Cellulosimicrobium terreum]|nr:hypothetical protein [Cellulosimicrobium terreum]